MFSRLVKASAIIVLFFLCVVFGQTQNDLKITIKNTFAGQSFESTTYIKGSRERTEQVMPGLNMSMATIEQCDMKRSIQLSDATKKYVISEQADIEDAAAPKTAPKTPSQPTVADKSRSGGVVTFVVSSVDTGERKQMFGYTARHIKTSMSSESSPDACNKTNQKIDMDGWYIDFQYGFSCATRPVSVPRMPSRGARPSCQDQIHYRISGGAKRGFAVLETTTVYDQDGKPQMSMTKEVTQLSKATLDQALFEIPAGYTEVSDSSQLYSMRDMVAGYGRSSQQNTSENTRPAIPSGVGGGITIGVVGLNNSSGQNIATDNFRDHLISRVGMAGINAIALDSTSPDDIVKEAKEKNCTYILYTDISTMKPASAAKKMGGMLGRMGGIGGGSSVGKSEAKVDFKLLATSNSTTVLQSSSSAKEDGDETTINSALDQEAGQVIRAAMTKR